MRLGIPEWDVRERSTVGEFYRLVDLAEQLEKERPNGIR